MENIIKDKFKTKLKVKDLKIGNYTFTFDKNCTISMYGCSGCDSFGIIYNISGMIEDKYIYKTFKNGYVKLVYCKCWNDDDKHEIYVEIFVEDEKNSKISTDKLKENEWQHLKLHLDEKSENKNESFFVRHLIKNGINIFGKDKVFVNY